MSISIYRSIYLDNFLEAHPSACSNRVGSTPKWGDFLSAPPRRITITITITINSSVRSRRPRFSEDAGRFVGGPRRTLDCLLDLEKKQQTTPDALEPLVPQGDMPEALHPKTEQTPAKKEWTSSRDESIASWIQSSPRQIADSFDRITTASANPL